LVPGDLVFLEAGDRVPADIFLLSATDCQVIEAVLTGEAAPVRKKPAVLADNTPLAERTNMLFCGTVLCNGTVTGIVADTGGNTEFGKIAELTGSTPEEPSPLQLQTSHLAKKLGLLGGGLCALIIVLGYFQGFPIKSMFMFGISLAVAAIPEGLPAVLTITLALGMKKMKTKRCLVRRLTATETLGATSVIATDKTGTLTKNEMTVTQLVVPEPFFFNHDIVQIKGTGYAPQGDILLKNEPVSKREDVMQLLEAAVLCNHASIEQKNGLWMAIGDPTEAALIVAGHKANITTKNLVGDGLAAGEISFDSVRKRMSMVWQRTHGIHLYVKGAPEMVLDQCQKVMLQGKAMPFTTDQRQAIHEQNKKMASEGVRVLAVATRVLPSLDLPTNTWEQELVFLGLVGIIDPPRDEAAAAVQAAHTAGIQIAVATGDNALTAGAIGKAIGLEFDKVITGNDLDNTTDEELYQILQGRDTLFARVTPEHKMRLAKACQTMGKIVTMTGDGVNDAPALRQANVGVAMGLKGSAVAQGASDVILLDDSFSSMVAGIKEGRRQFSNIKKFIWYMLCSNFGEVIILTASLFMGWKVLVLLPVQVLWLNMVTDGATALSLGFENPEPGIMDKKPRNPKAPLLSGKALILLGGIGLYKAIFILWIFYQHWHVLGNRSESGLLMAQTMALTGMVIFSKINVFNFRALETPLSKIGFFSNRFLIIAVIGTLLVQIAAVYTPFLQNYLGTTALPVKYWFQLAGMALPLLFIGEAYKTIMSRNTST
jgi:P-type Ca2+ transporter type 2C